MTGVGKLLVNVESQTIKWNYLLICYVKSTEEMLFVILLNLCPIAQLQSGVEENSTVHCKS